MAVDKRGRKLPKGIRQRSEGFEGRFMYQGKSYLVHGKTITETQKLITELKYKLEHGIYVVKEKITLDEWFTTWLEEYKKNRVKLGTYTNYEKYYKSIIKNRLGSRQLSEIRGEHIQKLYNELVKEGYALSSIKIVSAVLNGCLQQAMRNGLIERNPVRLAELPRQTGKRKERIAMTKEQQELFMEYAKDSEIADICELFLSTGLRSGELRGLDWETDIDFKNKVIHVTGTLCHSGETGWRKDEPKTRTSKRDIPMLGNVERLLKRVRRQQMEKKLYMGDKWQPVKGFENLVFLEESGLPMYQSSLKTKVDKIQRAIIKDGHVFEWITPHTFRHTFATRCIENGIPPQVLKGILGHSTLSMTMDLYAHVLPDTKAKELQKIANLF